MKTFIIIGAFFIIASCGIKGDPLPPAELESVQKQEPTPAEPTAAITRKVDQKKYKK